MKLGGAPLPRADRDGGALAHAPERAGPEAVKFVTFLGLNFAGGWAILLGI